MKLLIAVDDKSSAETLSEFVRSHRWPPDVQFRVLNVMELAGLDYILDYCDSERLYQMTEERERRSRSIVMSVGTSLRESFPRSVIDEVVERGDPRAKIVGCAKSWGADAVVIGSHGRSGLDRLLLGSVSTAVLASAPCSVMVVRTVPKESRCDGTPDLARSAQSKADVASAQHK